MVKNTVRHLDNMRMRLLPSLLLRSALCLGAAASGPVDMPDYYSGKFDADAYIRTAVDLQSLGHDAALMRLREIAQAKSARVNVIILCRMLFTKRSGSDFEAPALGSPVYLGGTTSSDWPLDPITLVDGVPFLITDGYVLAGFPVPAFVYLQYCESHADWSTFRFSIKTKQQEQGALLKLIDSSIWRPRLPETQRQYLASQIK
jgi:hypothetical protein